jgi:polyvinyl alcohol dehydrogenase (cytochrome)
MKRLLRSTLGVLLTPLLALACSSQDEPPAGPGPGGPQDARTLDWKGLGYDLGSTYWNKAETKISTSSAPTLSKVWEFDTKATASSTVVISGGRVYISSSPTDPADPTKGGLIALDLATGAEIWRNVDAAGPSSLALDGNVLYMHDFPGNVRAFDVTDGHQLWEYKTDENANIVGFSSPVVTKDLVLVGGSGLEEVALPAGMPATFRGFVLALNKDGTLAWKKYTVEPPHNGVGIWSTLSVDESAGMVVAATGNNYTGEPSDTSDAFLALPLATGADFLWKTQILTGDVFTSRQSNGNPDADFGANPILFDFEGRKLAAGGNKGGNVWVIDRATGVEITRRNIGPSSAFKGGVFNNGAWDGSSILVLCNGATSTGPGSEEAPAQNVATLFALHPLTLDIKWERQVNGPAYSPITVANGVGFFGKGTTLEAFDTATGARLFEYVTAGTIVSAPAISDGYVIFGAGMSWIGTSPGSTYHALKVQ